VSTKGLSIKDVRNQGGGGSSDVDVRTFCQKASDFSKFMVCPHGQGEGVKKTSEDIFWTRGGGFKFS